MNLLLIMYATYLGKMKANKYIIMLSLSGWHRKEWQHLVKKVIRFRGPINVGSS